MYQYLDVFRSLKKNKVKYVVIGGIALILHGVQRATYDLDILIEASEENAKRLLKALIEAGLGLAYDVTVEQLLANEVTLFRDRVHVDVQTSTPGIDFNEAWASKMAVKSGKTEAYIVSLEDLIASKKAAGRPKDLEDLKRIETEL